MDTFPSIIPFWRNRQTFIHLIPFPGSLYRNFVHINKYTPKDFEAQIQAKIKDINLIYVDSRKPAFRILGREPTAARKETRYLRRKKLQGSQHMRWHSGGADFPLAHQDKPVGGRGGQFHVVRDQQHSPLEIA